MNNQLETTNNEIPHKNIYKYENAKKIYFAQIKSKCFLIEKNKSKSISISLKSRNTFIYNLKTGLLLFSSNK